MYINVIVETETFPSLIFPSTGYKCRVENCNVSFPKWTELLKHEASCRGMRNILQCYLILYKIVDLTFENLF